MPHSAGGKGKTERAVAYLRNGWEYWEGGDAEAVRQALRFRMPMQVRQIRGFRGAGMPAGEFLGFPACPRCGITMERKYQAYCDRCGQRLGWKGFGKAAILFLAEQNALEGNESDF